MQCDAEVAEVSIRQTREALEERIASFGSAVVAFSGGVDSSVVAALAHRVLGAGALAVTAVSESLASGEREAAVKVAREIGIAHELVPTGELRRAAYRQNGRDRCYHCKTELYEALADLAESRGYRRVLSGANAEDLGDWRPGLRAAAEHGVRHPLMETGVTKDVVRGLARELAVSSADKPASPCLASRIPYGTPVDPATLRRVDSAEQAVRRLGYGQLRVRHYGEVARVELTADELPMALTPAPTAAIKEAVRSAGYRLVRIDRRPFRSGSLNRVP